MDIYKGGTDGRKSQHAATTKNTLEETKKIVVTKETGAITKQDTTGNKEGITQTKSIEELQAECITLESELQQRRKSIAKIQRV